MRLKIIRIIITIFLIFVTVGLLYTQGIRGWYYYALSKNNRIRIVPLEGERGRIKDRNDYLLAENVDTYHVVITPQEMRYPDKIFQFLSEALGVSREDLRKRYLARKLAPFAPVLVAENVPREAAIIIEENKFLYPSVMIQKSFQRRYPEEEKCAHIIGYVGRMEESLDRRLTMYGYAQKRFAGKAGIEKYHDDVLKGTDGGYQIEVNNYGQQVRLLSIKQPTKGKDVTLTIDRHVQDLLTELLKGRVGSIIVMDLKDGEILGMVSAPSYDPNIFTDIKKQKKMGNLFVNPLAPLLNRSIKGLYPPGSVFKIPIAIAALDMGLISEKTTFRCGGYYELGDRRFGCTHVHGSQDLIEGIAHSCNVYFFHLGIMIKAEKINRYARLFNLGEITGVDLPYEEAGYIPSPAQRMLTGRRWYGGDTLNFSIGQGDVLTTPLQLVHMMAIVANEGRIVHPHFIKMVGDQPVEKYQTNYRLKIPENIFQSVKDGLRATVTHPSGTAHELDLKGVYIAGKTGTAQTREGKEHHAWFVGYASGDKKNIAFCVFLEHGGSSQEANIVARKMLLKMRQEKML